MHKLTNLSRPFASKFSRWIQRIQPNSTLVVGALSILVGLASGIGVWLFKRLIDLIHTLFYDGIGGWLSPLGGWTAILLPVLGGLAVGLIAHYLVGQERHHGVAGIMESVALAGGRLRYKRVPAKAIGAALSIGSGASVGPEDPSVQIGANLGSMLGQWLNASDERTRVLVAAGAAGGISAAFNAPIAGVFFALEIILGEISGGALGMVVLASVVSAVFTQAVSGPQPAFQVPAYPLQSPAELPLYLVLGMLAGPVAALYVRLLFLAQDFFHGLRLPGWVKPVLAGVIIGGVGTFLPQALGVGYSTIGAIFAGQNLAIPLLLALLTAKIILTPISIGGGFMGGVFAPSLYLGATLGGAFGLAAGRLFPTLGITPPAFAMVGMAAVLAGAVHAPLTAILLLFEMTNDYRIILPLMFAVVVSLVVSQALQRDSVYTLSLARKGIRLERGRDVDVLQSIRVSDVMQTGVETLQFSASFAEASDALARTHRHGLPVVDDSGSLFGIVTIQDLDHAASEGRQKEKLEQICTRDLVLTYPDETIGTAMQRMSPQDLGRLPVVDREDPHRLVGVLRRHDIIRAYDLALSRRAALRHRVNQVRLGALSDEKVSVIELRVEAGAFCDGKAVRDIHWPQDTVLASLRRGRRLLIPHGDTVLKEGDVLVTVASSQAIEQVARICKPEA